MKMPTRKEIAIDTVWLMFRFAASSVYWLAFTPVFTFYAVMCFLLVLIGFLMSITGRLGARAYFFNDTPEGYFKRSVISMKLLMRYKEWNNEREK